MTAFGEPWYSGPGLVAFSVRRQPAKGGLVITLIAEHWGDPTAVEKGMEAFKRNSEKLKNTKGFVSRSVLRSQVDSLKFTTVTTFATTEAYEEFMKGVHERTAQRAREGTPSLFRGEKLEAYEVLLSD